jgi:predicted MFS family arabinose efflux permease
MYNLNASRERRLLWLLALTQFTLIVDFIVMMPLGPQIMENFRITPSGFATAVSAYSWCSGLSGLFAATYIDRFDRRKLLLAMYALFALANFGCASASTFPMLLIARAFTGITAGVLGSVILAIVSDVIPAMRRGAAMGTIMMSMSLATIVGVPAGITLGAHLGWAMPFLCLAGMSALIWVGCTMIVPPLSEHLSRKPAKLGQVLPDLGRLIANPRHLNAFVLTFVMNTSQMMVIPFIAPMLVANHGVPRPQLAWLYMAGGASIFFTSRYIGRLSDRYGKPLMFRIIAAFSVLPVLYVTHLPRLPFLVLVATFPFFMISMTGRMIPMQALLTTVPDPSRRGAFLSTNSALQSVGSGCGAWLGGLLLSTGAGGAIVGYGNNGWVAVALVAFAWLWISRVKPFNARPAPIAMIPEGVVET